LNLLTPAHVHCSYGPTRLQASSMHPSMHPCIPHMSMERLLHISSKHRGYSRGQNRLRRLGLQMSLEGPDCQWHSLTSSTHSSLPLISILFMQCLLIHSLILSTHFFIYLFACPTNHQFLTHSYDHSLTYLLTIYSLSDSIIHSVTPAFTNL
jgi:hypothetical protein